MASYSVIWRHAESDEPPVAGRLEVTHQGAALHGGVVGEERRLEIPACEIVSARRTNDHVGVLRASALDTRCVGTILIAAIGGPGYGSEILQRLQRLASLVA